MGGVTGTSGRDGWDAKVIVGGVDLLALPSLRLHSLSFFPLPTFPRLNDTWCLRIGGSARCGVLFALFNLIQNVVYLHFFCGRDCLHQWHMTSCVILR